MSGTADRGIFPGTNVTPAQQPATAFSRAFGGADGQVGAWDKYGLLAARILISQIFLVSGIMKIVDWSGTEAHMAQQHMFWIPFFHVTSMLVEVLAGLSLLLGYQARLGALVLFLYLIPVTFTFHHFWSYPPEKQQEQMFFFIHNLALMGGLLLIMAHGPGPLSWDFRRRSS